MVEEYLSISQMGVVSIRPELHGATRPPDNEVDCMDARERVNVDFVELYGMRMKRI
jgi:hypothetical protein